MIHTAVLWVEHSLQQCIMDASLYSGLPVNKYYLPKKLISTRVVAIVDL